LPKPFAAVLAGKGLWLLLALAVVESRGGRAERGDAGAEMWRLGLDGLEGHHSCGRDQGRPPAA
jgi:hypothetical protein